MSYQTEESSITASPLQWPRQHQRSRERPASPFKTTLGAARDGLLKELDLLGATGIIVSSNLPLKRDGTFYARPVALADPGVAVYFTFLGAQRVLASDKWSEVAGNVQALRKTVEAMRGLERWGCSDILAGTFTGLKALPAAAADAPDAGEAWTAVLGLAAGATEADIRAAARNQLVALVQQTQLSPAEREAAQARITLARSKALATLS